MSLFQADHPFWAWSTKIVSVVAMLTVILYFSANNFDETEMKVITWFGGFLTFGTLPGFVKKVLNR